MAPLTMEQIERENNGDTSSITSLQLTHRALSDARSLAITNFPNFISHLQPGAFAVINLMFTFINLHFLKKIIFVLDT